MPWICATLRPTLKPRRQRPDVARQVRAAIDQLPERQRAALVLAHYDGLGNIETADVMDTTVEAVESLLGRARRTLKKNLAGLQAEIMEN